MNSGGLQAGEPTRVGRYSVLRQLGRGGMSTVYRAYDPELDRQVALKLVSLWDKADREGPARLIREARSMAKISHPNVASVYDVGLIEDTVYIAMELIEGPTLERWIGDCPRPWTEVLRMYLDAGRGLAAAHDAGLVHRDFKPDNVMVGPDARPRVLDFGLARPATDAVDDELLLLDDEDEGPARDLDGDLDALTAEYEAAAADASPLPRSRPPSGPVSESFDLQVDVTRNGVVTGTPAYMAPEQHAGALGGPAADQFAFCVSMWEALYRRRPFEGASFFEVADAITAGRIDAPPRATKVPDWLRVLLERGLATDPGARHPSLRSLIASVVFTFKVMHGVA